MKFPWEKERRFLVLGEEEEGEYGKRPEDRSIEELLKACVINVDKPPGPTSHEVSSWVKKILGVKTGHGGTLDPKVTGVLPVGCGKGTKVMNFLLSAGKEYVCLMKLHGDVDEEKIREVLNEFVGKIFQKPPVKSSVKRRLRVREIYWINLLEIDGRYVLFRVGTEAGTYIRKLCHDVGLALGTGANMLELRRTQVGSFKEEDAVILQDLLDAYVFWKEEGKENPLKKILQPIERAVDHLKKIIIRDSAVSAIVHGADLAVPGVLEIEEDIKRGDTVAIMTKKGELVAVAEAKMDAYSVAEAKKGIVADTKRVLMEKGIYPKMWGKS